MASDGAPGNGPPEGGDDGSHRLRITAERGARVTAALHGRLYVEGDSPDHHLRLRTPPSGAPAQADPALLARLAAWRDSPPAEPSVLLLYGGSRSERSSLTTEFASSSARGGWTVADAHLGPGPRTTTGGRLLVIVEEAGPWSLDGLQLLATDPALRTPERARLLLTTDRPPSLPALRHRLRKAGLPEPCALRLPGLPLPGTTGPQPSGESTP
ncbi:hypothetical protein ACIA8O_01910 [Kitasatospora sp. NPDC051853]|uniref:hypothetical protein n=1 Tax=Kitasatospora sp. NPDC051853 TaxID=3364058 RepID=UPI0037BE0A43